MITVKIFDDGSGIKTWSHQSGKSTTHSITPEEVQAALKSVCANDPKGCGTCGDCSIKAGWREWKAEQVRNQAREYLKSIDENDFVVFPDTPVEFVEGGAWVAVAAWIPTEEEDQP